MKIVFFSTNFHPDPGGIAEFSHQVCAGFAARGHEVIVLTHRARGESDESITPSGYRLARVFDPCPFSTMRTPYRYAMMLVWKYSACAEILRIIRGVNPDLIFAGNYNSILTAPVLKRVHVPYYILLHGGDVLMGLSTPFPLRRNALKRTISESRWVFCNSSYTANLTKRLCTKSAGRLSVIGCGIPLERIVAQPDQAAARQSLGFGKERILLTVARLVPNKGIANVIRAMPLILERHPDCRYVVVGDGGQRPDLESLSVQLGLREHVRFMGFVSEEIRDFIYQAANLFVMTSEDSHGHEIEGFGITFLEANASGLAVVGSRVGGIPDAVDDGLNGLLVEPRNPVQLAQVVDALLDDPQRCQKMARKGVERIKQRFNWSSIATDIESRLLCPNGPAPPATADAGLLGLRP